MTETFFCIPHSHWEGAVFKTREQYLEIGLPHILHALHLLQRYPDYRYTIDQACYVRPFLERYPEEAVRVRRFVAEGRLAIVGGTDVMPDVNMPGGESFVRQVLYGKGYFQRALGIDVTTCWQLDTFGHHAQMPQLLKRAGFRSFWFFRGVASWETPSEFLWEGLDGTQFPVIWLPQGYGNLYGSPKTLPEFTEFVKQRYDVLTPQAGGGDRVGIAAMDVGVPEDHLPPMLEAYNRQSETPFRLQFAVPADFEQAITKQERLVIGGELNPIFQGIYSSRIELKQRTRELETLLTTAEKLGVLLAANGAGDAVDLWAAWEPMLFNQAHDLMAGVMTDEVYEDTLHGYDFSRRLAVDAVQTRMRALTELVDTRGDGIPLVVFNGLGWARSDIVQATVGLSTPGVRGLVLREPNGQDVPVQLVDAHRLEDGSLCAATVAFVARDVPALGYAIYHLLPQANEVPTPVPIDALENDLYRVEVDDSGAITRLLVKDGGWDALRAPGNVVAMEEDQGDLWEIGQPLDGGSRIAMTAPHPVAETAVFSTAQQGTGAFTHGPVFAEFTVEHPFSDQGRFRTTIRLYHGLPRIDIRTTLRNYDARVRYRLLFPTAMTEGENVHEIPFGVIARPAGIEFPAQNWIDWGNGEHGLALHNRGLPGNTVADGTLMLSLMRSTSIVAYGYVGGYEPGAGSESGLELGKELTFEYALVPHAGSWQQAAPWRDGQAFNHPLLACTAVPHPGPLPLRWGWLDVKHPNVVLSALKMSEGGTRAVLRLYETAGQSAEADIVLPSNVATIEELDLLERPLGTLVPVDGHLRLAMQPFEIHTVGIVLK